MKNYPFLIQQKLLEAICEKLEIDHAAIVKPLRAKWEEAFTKDKAERDAKLAKILGPTVELCAEEDRPRLEAKLRNLDAERNAAYLAWHEEDDPIERAKLQVAWEHLSAEETQLKKRLGLVATR